ncbi:unnamed protein product [Lactuca virosa]|uniref:Cucumisin n=1 Tax=Lactuca virosa TaxID=75947 RepID=A0AAU9NDA6_9ASTR|nr:unnamed protein product [Lactuca virosa]
MNVELSSQTYLHQLSLLLNLCLLLLLLPISIQAESEGNRQVYVVYMGHNTLDDASASSLHLSMLQQVIGWDSANHMLQRYTKSFHGFAARLTEEEAAKLSGMEGVVSVFPSRMNKMATTSSWDFLGFPITAKRSTKESDIIIGVFDSGIWPESPSLNDKGYGPPPAKWKGICEANFTCNNCSMDSFGCCQHTKNPDLITPVKLGNGIVVNGVSVNPFTLHGMYPLIYAGDVPNVMAGFNGSVSRLCSPNSLDKNLVKGKIILCDAISSGEPEMMAGAVGSIMKYPGPYFDAVASYTLPVSVVNSDQAIRNARYIQSTRNATAVIMKSKDVKNASAPFVASFSSRGPNPITKSILKPDLAAPGVRILAAWSPAAPITHVQGDHRAVNFNMISGTSMACPHVSGIAAYVKSYNPTWSPAAIKSALMTTASAMSAQINTDAEFAYGAGNLNQMKAIKPGLIYDAVEVDYVSFLCQEGYSSKDIRIMTGVKTSSCSQLMEQAKDLNYPTFVIPTLRNKVVDLSFNRTVTNVGSATSTYRASITQPLVSGLIIQVEPDVLHFNHIGQKVSFTVFVQATIQNLDNPIISSALIWDDGVHQVRSPIVVHVP